MTETQQLILDRYRPLSEAGTGGFGTVQVAWDTLIQRKVAIKCIELDERDAARAVLPSSGGAPKTRRTAADVRARAASSAGAATAVAPTRAAHEVHAVHEARAAYATRVAAAANAVRAASTTRIANAAGAEAGATAVILSVGDAFPSAPADDREATRVMEPVMLPWEDEAEYAARVAAMPPLQTATVPSSAPDPAALTEPVPVVASEEPLVHSLAHVPGLDEARTAAMLTDANIVAVYNFEVRGSMAYLIMEYVEGITLADLLERFEDQLTLDMVAAVFSGISHALEVAHESHVLHLDIKPANVLINKKGQVKVADFGLAMLEDASGFAAAGGGTIGYMPLEQMRQESLDERCDEWALASVLYEMLAGENPFLAPTLERAEAAIEDAELVLPSLCWDELNPGADDVIFYALDPDREERYENVTDFAEEMEPFLGDPKRGVRQLASLVSRADETQPIDAVSPLDREARPPRVPLRDRILPWHRAAAARAVGCVGSAAVSFVALSSMPQTAGFDNPLFWGLLLLFATAGALRPHLGALLSFVALSAAFIVQDAPAAGCVLLAAAAAWWYFLGRSDDVAANVTFSPILAGALGIGQLTPLAAGFCLRPAYTLGTVTFSLLISVLLGSLGSYSVLSWDAAGFWNAGMPGDVQTIAGGMLAQPALWCVAVSWFAAALALAVVRLRPTRAFSVLGVCVSTALLLAGSCVAAWVASGQVTWLPSVANLARTVGAAAVMLATCALVPDPSPDGNGRRGE